MKYRFFAIAVILLILFQIKPQLCNAADPADIDKMTTFSAMLGRAWACGINIEKEKELVAEWMDRKFPPGSNDQKIYLPIMLWGITFHAEMQKQGKTPDTCEDIKRVFRKMDWEKACSD